MIALGRRAFVAGSIMALAAPGNAAAAQVPATRYGLIGRIRAVSGQRDALIALLLEGSDDMPGCLSYIVAKDQADADAIWVTEVWDSEASHSASLQLPQVRAVIPRARPLIAGFDNRHETMPVGGIGLAPRR